MVIALFSAGLKVERALRWREWSTVTRLLVIGMPLLIARRRVRDGGDGALGWAPRSCSRRALAPTDPVLAGDIGVGPPGEEDEHEPHFAITAEAGFNDGLAFPFVLLGLAIAAERAASASGWLRRPGLRDRRRRRGRRRARLWHRVRRSCGCATASC